MDIYNDKNDMQEQLKRDPFTGLYNHKTFDEVLPKLMEDCKASDTCLSMSVLDIDHFKSINDKYGHAVGDRVLLKLAQILNSKTNNNISVFRIGGDEFAILLKEYCVNEAYMICEDIRSIISSTIIPEINTKITISSGVACMNKLHTNPVAFFGAADDALYSAKSSGKNKTVRFNGTVECIKES